MSIWGFWITPEPCTSKQLPGHHGEARLVGAEVPTKRAWMEKPQKRGRKERRAPEERGRQPVGEQGCTPSLMSPVWRGGCFTLFCL